jgi:hypothetical protein
MGQIQANRGSWTDLAALTIRVDARSKTILKQRSAVSPRKISCHPDDGYWNSVRIVMAAR